MSQYGDAVFRAARARARKKLDAFDRVKKKKKKQLARQPRVHTVCVVGSAARGVGTNWFCR